MEDSIREVNLAMGGMIGQVMDDGPVYMENNAALSNKDVLNIRNYLDTEWTTQRFDQMKNTYSTVFDKVQ